MHATLRKFGYPGTLVQDYRYWSVLLRPAQATLAALVLACREDATAFSAIGKDAAMELPHCINDIEQTLSRLFAYDRINYLMLMMVDPQVHFHVLPRYAAPKCYAGQLFADPGWPGMPDLTQATDCGPQARAALLDDLRANWPQRAEAS